MTVGVTMCCFFYNRKIRYSDLFSIHNLGNINKKFGHKSKSLHGVMHIDKLFSEVHWHRNLFDWCA